MAEPNQPEGQAKTGPEGATGAATGGEKGQSVGTGQTTGNGPGTTADESFFDPKTIQGKPELEAAYKQMQGAFTKVMQKVRGKQQKADAYERFEQDPQGTLRQLAQAYGFQLVQGGPQQNGNEKWEPQTWDEVTSRIKQEAKAEFMKEFEPVLKPVFDEVKNLRKASIEKSLDEIDPQWKLYEDDMMTTLQEHPSLVRDPLKLYRLSVPDEVFEAKYTKKALERLQGKAKSSEVSGGSTTTKQPSQVRTASNFAEAVQIAKEQLAEKGITFPGGA